MSIPHIEDLKPAQLIQLLTAKKEDLTISEKVDGSYFCFGHDTVGPYVSTKMGEKWYSAKDMPDVYYFSEFKRVAKWFFQFPLKAILHNVLGYRSEQELELVGELVPTHDHNIVIYDPLLIRFGVFCPFSLRVDGRVIIEESELKTICGVLNRPDSFSNIRFVSLGSFSPVAPLFDREFVDDVLAFYHGTGRYGMDPSIGKKTAKEWIESVARKPADKLIKGMVLMTFKKTGLSAKTKLFKSLSSITGLFGDEIEGFVIGFGPGLKTKVVDKAKFTSRKHQNWLVLDHLREQEKRFMTSCKSEPDKFNEHLSMFIDSIDPAVLPVTTFTIDRKRLETEEHLKMLASRIKKITKRVIAGESGASLAQAVLTREL